MSETVQRGNTGLAVKAGAWYVISRFLIKGISFITTPIFARVMDNASYGEFSNYASWQATLFIITGAELQNTLARAYYDYRDDYDGYVSSVTVTSCALTCLFYLFFLLCRGWIFNIVAIPAQYVHILFFTLTFQVCKSIYVSRERTFYRYKSVAVISITSLVIPTLISLALVLLAAPENKLSARIYGHYVPAALIGVICAAQLVRKKIFRLEHCRYAFRLALPLMLHYLTAYLLTSTNTIITKSILGASTAAIVSIAVSTIHIVTIFFEAITGAVTTWLMDNLEQKNFAKLRKNLLVYVGLLATLTFGVMLMAPEIIWILGGSRYKEAVWLIPGLATATFVQATVSLFTIILTYEKKITRSAIYTGIVATLSIAAKIILTFTAGYEAQPYVNLFAFLVLFVLNYRLVIKSANGECIHVKGFCGIIGFMLLFMELCPYLYEHLWLRVGTIALVAGAVLAVAYCKRSLILQLLRSLKKKTNTN